MPVIVVFLFFVVQRLLYSFDLKSRYKHVVQIWAVTEAQDTIGLAISDGESFYSATKLNNGAVEMMKESNIVPYDVVHIEFIIRVSKRYGCNEMRIWPIISKIMFFHWHEICDWVFLSLIWV